MSEETQSPAGKKRILIVDDHPLVRQGLKKLIEQEPDLQVTGEANNVPEALQSLSITRPDLVILDLSLPNRDGLEFIKTIKKRRWKPLVLVLSMHDETLYAQRAIRAGARGYIMKQESTDHTVAAIRRVLGGDIYLSEKMMSGVLERFAGGQAPSSASVAASLSDRELEVFLLLGKGRSTRQIANELHLSIKTVENYREQIKKKLGLKTGVELIQRAIQWVERGLDSQAD